MGKYRFLLLIFTLLTNLNVLAQFKWAEIGVDGLTCSACTRSVEMKIRKLPFVDSVSMNLENTDGRIFFKKGTKVVIEQLAQAVVDAGFSVRFLKAGFIFNNLNISENPCYTFENDSYQFIQPGTKSLNGEEIICFLGPKYLSHKELKKLTSELKKSCENKGERIYFVKALTNSEN